MGNTQKTARAWSPDDIEEFPVMPEAGPPPVWKAGFVPPTCVAKKKTKKVMETKLADMVVTGAQVRAIIGNGGDTVKMLRTETTADITITQKKFGEEGTVRIKHTDVEMVKSQIKSLLEEKGLPWEEPVEQVKEDDVSPVAKKKKQEVKPYQAAIDDILDMARQVEAAQFEERVRARAVARFETMKAAKDHAEAEKNGASEACFEKNRYVCFMDEKEEEEETDEDPSHDNEFYDNEIDNGEETTDCEEAMPDPLQDEIFTDILHCFRGDFFERDMAQSLGYASLALAIAARQASEHQALRCKRQSRNMIFVKTISKTVVVRVWKNATVWELRALVDAQTNFATQNLVLQYAGKRLEDTCTLSSYGIEEFSILHLLPSMAGGMMRSSSSNDKQALALVVLEMAAWDWLAAALIRLPFFLSQSWDWCPLVHARDWYPQ